MFKYGFNYMLGMIFNNNTSLFAKRKLVYLIYGINDIIVLKS